MALTHHDHDVPFEEQPHQVGAQPPLMPEGAFTQPDQQNSDITATGPQFADTQVIEPEADQKPFDASATVSYTSEQMAALRAEALQQATTPPEVVQAPPAKKRTWLKVGAPLVALASLVGVAGGVGIGKATSQSSTPSAVTAPVETTTTQQPGSSETTMPEAKPGIIDGEPTINVVRPNGEKITIARLRSPEDYSPDEVVESFMGLADCWGTTGDQACLDEISSRPDTQQVVIDMMDHVKNNVLQNNNMPVAPKAFQVATFKDPKDPAAFAMNRSGSTYTFTLESGTMRLNPYTTGYEDDFKWHDPQVLRTDYTFSYKMGKDFSLVMTHDAQGKTEVKTLNWSWSRS